MNSEHFSEKELTCRCGCGLNNATPELLELAEECRKVLGFPMIVHCACRCRKHNREVGGTEMSFHLDGRAMDFHVAQLDHKTVFNTLKSWREWHRLPQLGGLGLYDWGLHIDTEQAQDGHLRTWDERKKK